jgi:predicted secreted protein
MTWWSLLAIYFVVWWTILFAVLPWGMRTQEEEGEVILGTAASAPARPRLIAKAFWTSIVAAVIVAMFWVAIVRYGITFETIAGWVNIQQ